jgi:hypothetical protein
MFILYLTHFIVRYFDTTIHPKPDFLKHPNELWKHTAFADSPEWQRFQDQPQLNGKPSATNPLCGMKQEYHDFAEKIWNKFKILRREIQGAVQVPWKNLLKGGALPSGVQLRDMVEALRLQLFVKWATEPSHKDCKNVYLPMLQMEGKYKEWCPSWWMTWRQMGPPAGKNCSQIFLTECCGFEVQLSSVAPTLPEGLGDHFADQKDRGISREKMRLAAVDAAKLQKKVKTEEAEATPTPTIRSDRKQIIELEILKETRMCRQAEIERVRYLVERAKANSSPDLKSLETELDALYEQPFSMSSHHGNQAFSPVSTIRFNTRASTPSSRSQIDADSHNQLLSELPKEFTEIIIPGQSIAMQSIRFKEGSRSPLRGVSLAPAHAEHAQVADESTSSADSLSHTVVSPSAPVHVVTSAVLSAPAPAGGSPAETTIKNESYEGFKDRMQEKKFFCLEQESHGKCFFAACLNGIKEHGYWAKNSKTYAYRPKGSDIDWGKFNANSMRTHLLTFMNDFLDSNFSILIPFGFTTLKDAIENERTHGIVDYHQRNSGRGPQEFTSCSEYFELMGSDGAYANESIILATCIAFNVSIRVWLRGQEKPQSYGTSEFLVHICKPDLQGHYDALATDPGAAWIRAAARNPKNESTYVYDVNSCDQHNGLGVRFETCKYCQSGIRF